MSQLGTALLVTSYAIVFAYVCFTLQIAAAFNRSSNPRIRALFWVLPLLVAPICVGGLFLAKRLNPSYGAFDSRDVATMCLLVFATYLLQCFCWRLYVFRCRYCGATDCTCKTSWRNGVFWCPGCRRAYVNGHHREA